MRVRFEDLKEIAANNGLLALGVTSASDLVADRLRLSAWQASGRAGEMRYMQKDSAELTSPMRLVPGARSVILFSVPYFGTPHPELTSGHGRVARYAWGRDYHEVLSTALREFSAQLSGLVQGSCTVKTWTDSVPLLERALASRAGLGFIGKNTLLIRAGEGSFSFIAEAITDIEVEGVPPPVIKGTCGSCTRCGPACPTGALEAPFTLDARRCISYLTIEKRGVLTPEERRMLGEWVFGCDICQEVCPFNHRALHGRGPAPRQEFSPSMGAGPLLDLSRILRVRTGSEFEALFGHTPLMRTRRSGLLRNAAIVAANTRSVMAAHALAEAGTADPSPVVRQHCAWSLRMLHPDLTGSERDMAAAALEKMERDVEPAVRAEAVLLS